MEANQKRVMPQYVTTTNWSALTEAFEPTREPRAWNNPTKTKRKTTNAAAAGRKQTASKDRGELAVSQ